MNMYDEAALSIEKTLRKFGKEYEELFPQDTKNFFTDQDKSSL